MRLSRRSFITGSVAAAAASVVSPAPAKALFGVAGVPPRRIPLRREEHRVVIIGSGFGGGVAALRLAEAGVRDIVVLERGRRWTTGPNADTFPATTNGMRGLLWYGSAPVVLPGISGGPLVPNSFAGVLEAHPSPTLTVLNAAGVGGGSLVYQGMTLQPSRAVFEEVFPRGLDYDRLDRVFYPRVAKMLRVATAPDELINTPNYRAARVFRRNALAAGYRVDKVPMPIDWNYALAELRGEMKPSYTNGDCAMGVNNGGKHSVDVTYIAQAEATGRVQVRPLHNVTRVARTKTGGWQVFVDRTDVRGRIREQVIITTPALILAAGSVNTTKLLLRARSRGDITTLPDAVGKGWGSNGDRIVGWTNFDEDFGQTQGGPFVFDSKQWGDPKTANTIVQASIPPLGFNPRSTVIVGYGISAARGRWIYDPASDDTTLLWRRDFDREVHQRIWHRMTRIAGPNSLLEDTQTPAPMTWHPLGGACMGTVCDLEGRVRDNPGLYVLDGALMPGTTAACNPSMTIAALAERALEAIVARDVGARI